MAPDARISTALPSHPKTKKLARRLGPAGPLGCIYLFLWVASNRSDGDLVGMTDEDIELAVDWAGDDGVFVSAMVDVGFLEGDSGARRVHDWAEHNPWAAGAGARSEKSRWAALCKQHGRAEAARQMPEYAQRVGHVSQDDAVGNEPHCDGLPAAVPESASGTPLAETGSAPSPSPSPSPSPKEEFPPNPPQGVGRAVSFKTWIARVLEAGEKPIPDDDPVFSYAERAGIPRDFLALAWGEFKARHSEPGAKQYKDFRKTFRNCVRGNWYRLWTCDASGYRLTGTGAQAERVAEGAEA